MVIEISVAVIAAAFVVLVVFAVITLVRTRKTLQSVQKDMHLVSTEMVRLVQDLDELTSDIQKKSESLNFVFRPLKNLNKEKPHHHGRGAHSPDTDTMSEVVEWASTSIILFNKIKDFVKHYAKDN